MSDKPTLKYTLAVPIKQERSVSGRVIRIM